MNRLISDFYITETQMHPKINLGGEACCGSRLHRPQSVKAEHMCGGVRDDTQDGTQAAEAGIVSNGPNGLTAAVS